ncbi:MAG TPA: hypothetical protein VLE53_19560 [Gemmatimonadaceae bacterium]|nr:hypothetical protein [Gemmatimonadaceae bacterium]
MRFLPPDPSRGDENTIGGYMAVHGRPAAFEGSDGVSYSVAIEVDRTDDAAADPSRGYGAYFLFLRWRRIGPQGIEGHLESPFLAWGDTPEAARASLGALSLAATRATLEALIREQGGGSVRKWWDVMREEE